jgi:hypothetical protein
MRGPRHARSGLTVPYPRRRSLGSFRHGRVTVTRPLGALMRRRNLATLALLGSLLAPAPALAQHRLELRVTPRVGLLTPADWFYVEFPSFGAGPTEWTEAAIQRAPIAGLAVEAAAEATGVWLRAEVLRTIGAETAVIHALLVPASTAGPAYVVRTRVHVPTALTIGTLDLGLPTRLRLPGGIQPYVTAGLGGKRYDFDIAEIEAREERFVVPRYGVVPVVNVGVGSVLTVRGVTIDLLVRDAISEYWGELQHDVMFLAGASFRLR